jgi:hypothetical protein
MVIGQLSATKPNFERSDVMGWFAPTPIISSEIERDGRRH